MMAAEFSWYLLLLPSLLYANAFLCVSSEFQATTPTRICEPIRIELCRGIGYNETSLPNIIGHEMQSEVEFVLQTFTPLIEYICSTQLKLFLCAAYVPMCTPKVTVPIGPCRNLCENVRSRCLPVLQGFGFPWPPALDCQRFPRENNHETMCMEGPGEMIVSGGGGGGGGGSVGGHEITPPISKVLQVQQECYGMAKSHLYIKLNRSGRCAPICDADILFNRREKNFAEMWIMTWTYAALGMSLIATLCYILSDTKNDYTFAPLIWCNDMVVIGWTVRFMAGRDVTACGYDPQLPNVALLLVDGLANPSCAATFLLRYYFGMAACAWWSIICLDWHREVRQFSKNSYSHRQQPSAVGHERNKNNQLRAPSSRTAANTENRRSNLSVFVGWGIPAFQTAAVIVARFIDADELIGSCYAGNQTEKGLQALVATPLFCYWIFGTMNLVSGYLVDRNTDDRHHQEKPLTSVTYSQQRKNGALSRICPFLFIYSILSGVLLIAVIYEFLNIDLWLNSPLSNVEPLNMTKTPMWPFLTRPLMELILAVLTSAWVLGPIISNLYKIRRVSTKSKQTAPNPNNIAYACGSYQTVWQPQNNIILLNQISANKKYRCVGRHHLNRHTSETIL